MTLILHPYQDFGADWLLEAPRRYLGDKCSLGKTVQASVAALRLQDIKRAVCVTRAAAVENWKREWKKWGPGDDAPLTVVSYANRHLYDGVLDGGDYDVVILDEAHAAKNREAKRTIAALQLARQAPRAWLLSGSPSPNYDPYELWAPIRALWPEIPRALGIKTHTEWRDYFCKWRPTRYGPKTYGIKNADVLKGVLGKIMLRRSIEDVFGALPPVRVHVHLLPRDPAMERVIAGIAAKDKNGEWNATYRRVTGTFKAPRVADVIDQELKDGEYRKIVIMAYHHEVMDRIQEKLKAHGVVRLDGHTKDRQAVVDQFTEDPGIRVFLGQQGAAGEAINLTVASELVIVEPSHSPEENAQAAARLRAHLQGNRVRIRMFAVAKSQDEGVIENLAAKLRNRGALGL